MTKLILVNSAPGETRVAVAENGSPHEVFIEREQERGIAGNIYKGKVARVLPGIQAAFVDIGLDKAAFLHVSDSYENPEALGKEGGVEMVVEEQQEPSRRPPIEKQLSAGQEILVQVSKEPMGGKGARITSHVSLPGRYLVYMPSNSHGGISRRIENEKERQRLKDIMASFKNIPGGFIVRTACEGRKKKEITSDVRFLTKLWDRILRKSKTVTAPALVHSELDLVQRSIRDLFTTDVHKMIFDNPKDYNRAMDFVRGLMPRFRTKLEVYTQDSPIFDHFGIETDIQRALQPKIWLKSGGYIIIQQTEALVAIDVNTGRYIGRKDQEETALKTNLEAAEEIVRQLRLRNVGGIIIIDFIDMEKASNRKRVFEALRDNLKIDKARTTILRISELGLIQMTRKRTRESLEHVLCSPCPVCMGKGSIKSTVTVAHEILRAVKREARALRNGGKINIEASPVIATLLRDEEKRVLEELQREVNREITVSVNENFRNEHYEILREGAMEPEPKAELVVGPG
jgi:ribonuclease G